MKPNYKNWIPKGMIASSLGVTAVLLAITLGAWKTTAGWVFLIATAVGLFVSTDMIFMYRAFSYNGKRQLSKKIIEEVASHVTLPEGSVGLDVGCGSGALTIACAKRNPKSSFLGVDRWGMEYASFSQALCEQNAKAEGVTNVAFVRADATALPYEDGSFDAVVSNYVYHNIPSNDRQAILLETLRVLKKGGTFALHDAFSAFKYGDMQSFVQKLRDMGYEKVELISTTGGRVITKWESIWMMLAGSALLVGKK